MSEKISENYILRNAIDNDLAEINQIYNELSFNVGKHTNIIMFNADSEGFSVAEQIETGKILGVSIGMVYSPSFAYIGTYCVRKDYQRKGIGTKLWNKMYEHIGHERNISLLSVPEMVSFYRDKFGFVLSPQYKNIHYFGIPNLENLIKHIDNITIVKVDDTNLKDIIEYDKQICDEFSRHIYLKGYSKAPETVFLMAKNNTEKIKGYCIMTATTMDMALPLPLYADTKEIAELLMYKCCELMPIALTNGVLFRTFDCNKNAMEIALKINLKFTGIYPNLYTKEIINIDTNKIYCICPAGYYPY